MNPRKRSENPWRAAGLVGALGADLVVCMALGYFAGRYVSNLTGGQTGWIVAGVLAGLAVGIFSIVLLIKRFLEDTDE